MSLKVGQNGSALVLGDNRKRETPPRVTFRKVMESGAQLLVAGARVAGQIVGGPFLAAAMTTTGAAGNAASGNGSLPDLGNIPQGLTGNSDPMQALQDQRLGDDLKLLALQDQIQRTSRQVALVSNVMKARHDTAKSTISNMRS